MTLSMVGNPLIKETVPQYDNDIKRLESVKEKVEDAGEKTQAVKEPEDMLSLENVTKFLGGTALATVLAPAKALVYGSIGASEAALSASGLGKIGNDDSLSDDPIKDIGRPFLYVAPAIGAILAVAAGAGPVGVIIASFMLPGAIGGLGSAINGGLKGAVDGFELAVAAGDKVKEKVSSRCGETAGKLAKFVVGGSLALVATPGVAAMESIDNSVDFAFKAIGLKPPESKLEAALVTLPKAGGLVYYIGKGFVAGAKSGFISAALGGAMMGGAFATAVSGTAEAFNGFFSGVKDAYDIAGKAVDKLSKEN